jgi:hypothetical protein
MSLVAREVSVKTDFLDDSGYRGISWTDSPDAAKNPRNLIRKEFDAGRSATLRFTIAANGGFTAILQPSR